MDAVPVVPATYLFGLALTIVGAVIRILSYRALDGYDAIVDACCEAWNALTPERLRSLCAYPWIRKVGS